MNHFRHPDGSFGGEYGSRNVKYMMPHGLEILAGEFSEASALLQHHHFGLMNETLVSPADMDDRYQAFFANKYAEAWAHCSASEIPVSVPAQQLGSQVFPAAGLVVHSESDLYAVVGAGKHGIVKAYSQRPEEGLIFSDSGYVAGFVNGTIATTQWLDFDGVRTMRSSEGETFVRTGCRMREVDTSLPMKQYLVPFRLFLRLFGRWGGLMDLFGRRIKERKIISGRTAPLKVNRTVEIKPGILRILDTVELESGRFAKSSRFTKSARLTSFGRCGIAATLHVASSRYHAAGELDGPGNWTATAGDVEILNQGQTLEIETLISTDVGLSIGETLSRPSIRVDARVANKEGNLRHVCRHPFDCSLTTSLKAVHVLRYLDPQEQDDVLDVGCGLGYFLNRLAGRGKRGFGLDFSHKSLSISRKLTAAALSQGDAQMLPYMDNSFDKIIFTDVLEHVFDDRQSLREVVRVARPGARIALVTPGIGGLLSGTSWRKLFHDEEGTPEFDERPGYTPTQLRQLMEEAGIRVDRVRQTLIFLGEFFLQSTKRYLKKRGLHYQTQGDILNITDSWAFRLYRRLIFPVFWGIARIEDLLLGKFANGHSLIALGIIEKEQESERGSEATVKAAHVG